jgi:hypothetical protein
MSRSRFIGRSFFSQISDSNNTSGLYMPDPHYYFTAGSRYTLGSVYDPNSVGGQQVFTSSGTFTAPPGVTSVCVVCVGGGGGGLYYNNAGINNTFAMSGGGGGALAWLNDYPVVPGDTYQVVVGQGGTFGAYASGSTAGGNSYFVSTSVINAGGGAPGRYNSIISGGIFTRSLSYGTSGGGNGGGTARTSAQTYGPAGGGGAGGYSGNGGTGRDDASASGDSGSGGGGGGGGAASDPLYEDHHSGGGGGVGLLGQGASGAGNINGYGEGESGGANGGDPNQNTGTNGTVTAGGLYGGGGGGSSFNIYGFSGNGGNGAVRIIWGSGRAFPSTNTADV